MRRVPQSEVRLSEMYSVTGPTAGGTEAASVYPEVSERAAADSSHAAGVADPAAQGPVQPPQSPAR